MVVIYKTLDSSEIVFIKSLLIEADIPFFIENENTAGIAFGKITGPMTVMVPEEEEENARNLLGDFLKRKQLD